MLEATLRQVKWLELFCPRPEFFPSVCRSFALGSSMSDAFVVVMQGEKPIFLGRENLVTIHCQECGQRIIESEGANVMFTRDARTGDRQSFKILCQGCASHHDKTPPTSWIKLHEFVEALADSVGMKAERKSKIH